MDLFGHVGMTLERVPVERSDGDKRDDPEFTSAELLGFLETPIAHLADWFYWYVDIDPDIRFRKTRQLRAIIRKRKLTMQDLSSAWQQAKRERGSVVGRRDG